jgi:hypothetical protein
MLTDSVAALLANVIDPDDVPRVQVDPGSMRAAAGAITSSTGRVAESVASVAGIWSHLPGVLAMTNTLDPLYAGMEEPQRRASHLADVGRAIARTLGTLADHADEYGPRADRLRAEVLDFDRELGMVAGAASVVTGVTLDLALLGFASRARDLRARIESLRAQWRACERQAATDLNSIRAGIDAGLLVGGALTTAGLHGTVPGNPTAPEQLIAQWATGLGPRNQVFTGADPFARLIRGDSTIRSDIAAMRKQLASGGWTLGEPLEGAYGRDLSGLKGVPVFLTDAGTLYFRAKGIRVGNLGDTFLGSYAVEAVPVAVVGAHSVRMRITVRNTSTLSSGTRVPGLGYTDAGKQLDHLKDRSVPTGPLSETTQVITWTQVISWPHKRPRSLLQPAR